MNEENKKKNEDLQMVKQVLDKFKVKFYLAYGTCLGAYRDAEFLPGDDDIDIAIVQPVDLRTKKEIGWMLYDLGFQPQEIMFNVFGRMEPQEARYNGDEKTGIICCQKNIKFTIFFFNPEPEDCDKHGKEHVCIPKLGAMKLISTPARFYEGSNKVHFYGTEYNVPCPVEDYLAFTYFDNWEDKMDRRHGQTYSEAHPEYQEYIKDVMKKNEATIFKNN